MSDPLSDYQLSRLRTPDLPEPLVYAISPLSHWFWQDYQDRDATVATLVKRGSAQTPAFAVILEEIFDRLFAGAHPCPLPVDAPAWARQIHRALDDLLAFEDLAAQTQGDPLSSGFATTVLGEHCLAWLPDLLRASSSPDHETSSPGDDRATLALGRSLRSACEEAQQDIQHLLSLMQPFQVGWDNTQGAEQPGSFDQKWQLAQVLRQNAYLRRIAELAGRMRPTLHYQQRTKNQQGWSQLTGLETGQDLARLLPSEFLKLADPDQFPLFAQGYLERTLLQYQQEDRLTQQQGPLVICVDVSGSMYGERDLWAKAVALTFIDLAQQQQRHCRLIQFSETVKRVDDLPPGQGSLGSTLQALGQFFSGGGTQFRDPLEMALQAIAQNPSLKDADLIFITDGVGELTEDFLHQFRLNQQELQFSVYGVMIGDSASWQGLQTLQQFCHRTWQVHSLSADGSEIKELFAL